MQFYHDCWPVLHEDNHLLVLYKPSGLVMQRDHKNRANLLDLARQWVKERYDKPGNVYLGMVHRLDGPVAGAVVFARTSKAASRLSAQIREGRVEKRYRAVVEGRPVKISARLVDHLVRQGRYSQVAKADAPDGQEARLTYRCLGFQNQRSLLEVDLETGRRHQIRAQLAHMGCPIVGDRNYGASTALPNGRIALLARSLAFEHPTQKVRMVFKAPTPIGWPWETGDGSRTRTLWTIEEYQEAGLALPADTISDHRK